MKSTTIYIDGVGLVLFEKSKRAKYINITIKSNQKIRVGIPIGVPLKKAEAVVYDKINCIRKHMRKIELQKNMNHLNPAAVNREHARVVLSHRLHQLATKYGFQYNKVSIKNQETRWGSCSVKNNINLNMKLTQLPKVLMDYVILHELVHTRIKNHSKDFWTELDKIVGKAKQLDRELKKWSICEF